MTATVTPSAEIDAPSTPAKLGDLDRLGRRIAWAATDDPIYASDPSPGAARLSYADIDRIAKDEHMVPGYAIFPPADSTRDGATTYGSYTVVNRWPQRVSEQRTLYLNQFTGATITNATAAQDGGALSKLTSFGIAMHMGNQMGWLTRISATVACLGVLLSVATGLLMWWTRRPSGRSGLPGPASETTRANTPPKKAMIVVTVVAVILGILFPAFGISLLVVLLAEAIVAARRPPPGQASRVTSTTTSRSVEPPRSKSPSAGG